MEGPMVSTKDSLDLSKTALAKWLGHLGMVSKKVSQIQSGMKEKKKNEDSTFITRFIFILILIVKLPCCFIIKSLKSSIN